MKRLLNKNGQLISIENELDLLVNKPALQSTVLTREGVYRFIPKERVKGILINGGETEDLDDIEDVYEQVMDLESYLYQEFMKNKYDEGLMIVEDRELIDEILIIDVKMLNRIWDYQYWIYLDEYGNIEIDEKMIDDKEEFDKQFGMGKYEKTVDELERYEKEKYGK